MSQVRSLAVDYWLANTQRIYDEDLHVSTPVIEAYEEGFKMGVKAVFKKVITYTCILVSMFIAMVTFLVSYSKMANADDSFKLISSREVFINARNFFDKGRDPLLLPGQKLNKELNFNFNVDLLKYGYWDNRIWSMIDQGQFRTIGWNWKGGVRLAPIISVEYEHFSKHILDATYPASYGGFPVQDSIGFNLFLYRRDAGGPTIFNWN